MRIRTPLIIATLGAFTLAGCETMGIEDGSRTQAGAITGALIGATIGGTRKGDDKLAKAAVGAVVGGVIGGAIGNALDKQAAELRGSVSGNVQIVNEGNQLRVVMPQDILFATDSATLQPALVGDLRAVAQSLLNYPNSEVQVIGHTDNVGAASYNQDLSQRRANAVAFVLRDYGVPSGRVVAFGRGEDQPVASNLTDAGRQQNRRVEIIIRPTA